MCDEAVVTSYPEDVLAYDVQQEFIKTMSLAGANSIGDDAFEKEMKILAIAKENDLWLDGQ